MRPPTCKRCIGPLLQEVLKSGTKDGSVLVTSSPPPRARPSRSSKRGGPSNRGRAYTRRTRTLHKMSIPTSETHYLDSYSSSRSILSLKDIPGETNRTVLLIGLDTGRRSPLRSAPPTPLTFSRMLPSQTSSLPSRTTSTTGLVLISHTAPTSPPGGETPFGDAEAESAEWTQFVQD